MIAVRPLEDLRIVALEQYGAGPFGSVHLADLGAEVVKIEDPNTAGDVGRYVPPFHEGEDSLFFETFNRNKRSLSLDVTSPAGREVLEDLVRVSDAVWSNLRGDVPERLRITYRDLSGVNPRIVCCSLSAFGMTGPRKAEPGYDYILQGIAGWMSITGEPDGPPAKSGLSLVDYIGGIVGALAMVSAIHAARRDGRGMDCDVSLYDAAISMLTYPAVWHLNGGFSPERLSRSAHPSLVPFQNFPTADGWIVVGCAKEKFFLRLAEAIGMPELASDPRYVDFEARRQNRGALIPVLDEALRARTSEEWLKILGDAGVPCGPVNTVEQAFAEPQTEARGLIVTTEHPRFGLVRQPGSPVRVGDEPIPHRRAPLRNEDFDHVTRELLGYDDRRIEALRAGGAFGKQP
jgi:crotonobetainyl-CoA:carnitine CoA-transferase CaiB-like acyl-CoA transferase